MKYLVFLLFVTQGALAQQYTVKENVIDLPRVYTITKELTTENQKSYIVSDPYNLTSTRYDVNRQTINKVTTDYTIPKQNNLFSEVKSRVSTSQVDEIKKLQQDLLNYKH